MIKRTLNFGNPAYISLGNSQLLVSILATDHSEERKVSIPIEDIGIVILEHPQITVTHNAISALLENNVAIVTSDRSRLPVGLIMPLDGHSAQTERFREQIEASIPLKKNLWQQTVRAKILNQSAILSKIGVPIDNMVYWAASVKSGDSENHEARAAAYYWSKIFPFDFIRGRFEAPPNNLLNYGYAILRAMVARALVGSGLLPTLGIFHRNKYNAYCLADDIMEPYRPFVDKIVLNIVLKEDNFIDTTPKLKAEILKVAQVDVLIEERRSPLIVGLQRTTASLFRCFEGTQRRISYPEIAN